MGSPLFHRIVSFDYGDDERSALMLKVWSGTPWAVETWTGGIDNDQSREIMDWCRERWGDGALPIHGRPGRWYRGSATVHGWTFFGFETEAMMREFASEWKVRDEAEAA